MKYDHSYGKKVYAKFAVNYHKGTVLWGRWWWPWVKVSVHDKAVMWIYKRNLVERS